MPPVPIPLEPAPAARVATRLGHRCEDPVLLFPASSRNGRADLISAVRLRNEALVRPTHGIRKFIEGQVRSQLRQDFTVREGAPEFQDRLFTQPRTSPKVEPAQVYLAAAARATRGR